MHVYDNMICLEAGGGGLRSGKDRYGRVEKGIKEYRISMGYPYHYYYN